MFILLSQNHQALLVQGLGHKPEQTMPGNEKQPYWKWKPHPRNARTEQQTQNWGCHSGFHSAFLHWHISTFMTFWPWVYLMQGEKKKQTSAEYQKKCFSTERCTRIIKYFPPLKQMSFKNKTRWCIEYGTLWYSTAGSENIFSSSQLWWGKIFKGFKKPLVQ